MPKDIVLDALRNQMRDMNNSAHIDIDGIKVNVSITKMKKFCTIVVKHKRKKPFKMNNLDNILNVLNSSQSLYEYDYYKETNEIGMTASMWVDTKNTAPTQSSLAELINEMVSQIKSIENMLDNEEDFF